MTTLLRFILNRRRRAFSAVEIIAVATIIAILAVILIPTVRDPRGELQGNRRQ